LLIGDGSGAMGWLGQFDWILLWRDEVLNYLINIIYIIG
jgi:hypothetical protein